MDKETVRYGGEARLKRAVLEGQQYAVREDRWIADNYADKYDKWVRVQV